MNKSKILLFSLAIILFGIATVSLANGRYFEPSSTKPYFNGVYLGVGGGIVYALSDVNSTYHTKLVWHPDSIESITHDFKIGQYGFNANIFAGCGKTFGSPYYLGGELFANYFSSKVKGHVIRTMASEGYSELIILSTEVKNPYSFGGDLRAGYLVTSRTMLYVLFGLDYAKFNVKNEAVPLGDIPYSCLPVSNEFDKWRLGYMPGIGVEIGLHDHVSLRTQYTYTFYSSFNRSTSFVDSIGNGQGPVIVSLETKVKPQRNKFTVMLSYLFN